MWNQWAGVVTAPMPPMPAPQCPPPQPPLPSTAPVASSSATTAAIPAVIGPMLPNTATAPVAAAAVAATAGSVQTAGDAKPVVNSTDPSNPYGQYTAAQYAAMTPEQQYALQQHWQQWQTYQQEYAKWHAQYGEQYNREMAANSTAQAPYANYYQNQPPLPPPDNSQPQQLQTSVPSQPPLPQQTGKITGQPQMYSQPSTQSAQVPQQAPPATPSMHPYYQQWPQPANFIQSPGIFTRPPPNIMQQPPPHYDQQQQRLQQQPYSDYKNPPPPSQPQPQQQPVQQQQQPVNQKQQQQQQQQQMPPDQQRNFAGQNPGMAKNCGFNQGNNFASQRNPDSAPEQNSSTNRDESEGDAKWCDSNFESSHQNSPQSVNFTRRSSNNQWNYNKKHDNQSNRGANRWGDNQNMMKNDDNFSPSRWGSNRNEGNYGQNDNSDYSKFGSNNRGNQSYSNFGSNRPRDHETGGSNRNRVGLNESNNDNFTEKNLNRPQQQQQQQQQQKRVPELDEESFDRQFRQWEEQFEDWKRANVNHPDREMYQRYEEEFEKQRKRIMDRREQMRKRKMEQMGMQRMGNFKENPTDGKPSNINIDEKRLEIAGDTNDERNNLTQLNETKKNDDNNIEDKDKVNSAKDSHSKSSKISDSSNETSTLQDNTNRQNIEKANIISSTNLTSNSANKILGKRRNRFEANASKSNLEVITLDEDADQSDRSETETQHMPGIFGKSQGIPGLDLVNENDPKQNNEKDVGKTLTILDESKDETPRPPKMAALESNNTVAKKLPSLFDIVVDKPSPDSDNQSESGVDFGNINLNQSHLPLSMLNDMSNVQDALRDPSFVQKISLALAKAQGRNEPDLNAQPTVDLMKNLPELADQLQQSNPIGSSGEPMSFAEWQRRRDHQQMGNVPNDLKSKDESSGNSEKGSERNFVDDDNCSQLSGSRRSIGDDRRNLSCNDLDLGGNRHNVERDISDDGNQFGNGPNFGGNGPYFGRNNSNFGGNNSNFGRNGRNDNFGRNGPYFGRNDPNFRGYGPQFGGNGNNGPNFDDNVPNFGGNGNNGPNFGGYGNNGPNFGGYGNNGPNFGGYGNNGPNFGGNGNNGPNFGGNGNNGPNFGGYGNNGPNFGGNGNNGPNFGGNGNNGPNFGGNGNDGPNFGNFRGFGGPNFDGNDPNSRDNNRNFGGNFSNFGGNAPNFSGNGRNFNPNNRGQPNFNDRRQSFGGNNAQRRRDCLNSGGPSGSSGRGGPVETSNDNESPRSEQLGSCNTDNPFRRGGPPAPIFNEDISKKKGGGNKGGNNSNKSTWLYGNGIKRNNRNKSN